MTDIEPAIDPNDAHQHILVGLLAKPEHARLFMQDAQFHAWVEALAATLPGIVELFTKGTGAEVLVLLQRFSAPPAEGAERLMMALQQGYGDAGLSNLQGQRRSVPRERTKILIASNQMEAKGYIRGLAPSERDGWIILTPNSSDSSRILQGRIITDNDLVVDLVLQRNEPLRSTTEYTNYDAIMRDIRVARSRAR